MSRSSSYPSNYDALPKPEANNNLDDPGFEHDDVHARVADAIEKLEQFVGDNSVTPPVGTVRREIVDHEANADGHHNKSHAHDGADGSGTVGHGSLSGVSADQHHAQVHGLADHNSGSARISVGVDGSKPAAATADRLYFATDTGILYRDTGAAWVELARAETSIRLAQLSEKLHSSLTGVTADQHHPAMHTHAGATEGQTLTPGTLNLPQQSPPAQTAEGEVKWDQTNDLLTVGDGVSRKTFYPGNHPAQIGEVEVSLSGPGHQGNFQITGLSGLTANDPVIIYQASGPYTGKGTRADEAEMDQVSVAGRVLNATTIQCYWRSVNFVRGNFKFAYITK